MSQASVVSCGCMPCWLDAWRLLSAPPLASPGLSQVPAPPHIAAAGYSKVQFTLVDCPGHASLIRTIIGGAQVGSVWAVASSVAAAAAALPLRLLRLVPLHLTSSPCHCQRCLPSDHRSST